MRAIALAAAAVTALAGLAGPSLASAKPKKPATVKVMTRNLYLGADLIPAIAAPTPAAAMEAAGDIYRSVIDTNFHARAKLLAAEINASKPDLIGMQEVAIWRRGQFGSPDGDATPSEEVIVDYLDTLQHELKRLGLEYRVAVVQQEADIELPVDLTDDATQNPTFDGRLTMRDVILARKSKNLKLSNKQHKNYTAFINAPTALGDIPVIRGYTRVDVTKGKNTKPFRVINTHLEAFSAYIRNNQAVELVGAGGPTSTNMPILLIGDMNSDPDDPSIDNTPPAPPTANALAYNTLTGAGFADRGVEVDTCCHDADLRDDPSETFGPNSRIDHILSKGTVTELSATLIGDDPALRTGTNLWPTDHGGVVARLKVG
jgi:endonuclease/exonuclease/phosphatase family metal-dependent hydrolase